MNSARTVFACLLAPLVILPILACYIGHAYLVNGTNPVAHFGPLGAFLVLAPYCLVFAYPAFGLLGYPVCMYLRASGRSSYLLHGALGLMLGVHVYFLVPMIEEVVATASWNLVSLLKCFAVPGAFMMVTFRLIAGRPGD